MLRQLVDLLIGCLNLVTVIFIFALVKNNLFACPKSGCSQRRATAELHLPMLEIGPTHTRF